MLQRTQMCEVSMEFRRLLYNPAILDAAEQLMGTNIQLFHDQALFKPALDAASASFGGNMQWHQVRNTPSRSRSWVNFRLL
jgi:hypothetical protein